jgi:hypothetical protein
MSTLLIECFVTGPGGTFVTTEYLKAFPNAMGDRKIDIFAGPSGGVTIADDDERILVEDSLSDAAGFFLDELPDLLRAGKGATYEFRTGAETTTVAVDQDKVTITNYNGKVIETTVPEVVRAATAAKADYENLLRATGKT